MIIAIFLLFRWWWSIGGVFLTKNLEALEVVFGRGVLRKRKSAVGNFVVGSGVRSKKYSSASDLYAGGAGAKIIFAHGRLWSSVGGEKQS